MRLCVGVTVYVEPAGAQLVAKGEWEPHKVQGWAPDFVPDILRKEVAHAVRRASLVTLAHRLGGGGGGDGGGDGGGGGVITGSWQQRTALRVAVTDKAQ